MHESDFNQVTYIGIGQGRVFKWPLWTEAIYIHSFKTDCSSQTYSVLFCPADVLQINTYFISIWSLIRILVLILSLLFYDMSTVLLTQSCSRFFSNPCENRADREDVSAVLRSHPSKDEIWADVNKFPLSRGKCSVLISADWLASMIVFKDMQSHWYKDWHLSDNIPGMASASTTALFACGTVLDEIIGFLVNSKTRFSKHCWRHCELSTMYNLSIEPRKPVTRTTCRPHCYCTSLLASSDFPYSDIGQFIWWVDNDISLSILQENKEIRVHSRLQTCWHCWFSLDWRSMEKPCQVLPTTRNCIGIFFSRFTQHVNMSALCPTLRKKCKSWRNKIKIDVKTHNVKSVHVTHQYISFQHINTKVVYTGLNTCYGSTD